MTNREDFIEGNQGKRFLDDVKGYYVRDTEPDEVKPISERIKELRKLKGFSLEKLAQISGLESEYLSQIENEEISPDLGSVVKLSKALKITTGLLLDEESDYSYSVVRHNERKKIKRFVSGKQDAPEYEYQSLASGIKNKHMETFIVTLNGEKQDGKLSHHEGEEFIMVLKGKVRIHLSDKEEILNPGDTIYFLSSIPHQILPFSPSESAEILAVIFPNTN